MLNNQRRVLGAITDLFVIAIMVRVPKMLPVDGDSLNNRPISFISHRVVNSRSFLLQLMFLLGDYNDNQWTQLLSRSNTSIELNDLKEEKEGEKGRDEKCLEENKPHPSSKNDKENNVASRTRSNISASTFAIDAFCSDDREDFIADSTKRLLQWECNRHGLAYLSEDELHRRNKLVNQSK
jgi:hypothetical protein